MMRSKLAIIVLCVALARGVALAASVDEVIQRAHDADQHVNYRGVKTACVWLNGVPTSSVVKIVHMKPGMTRKDFFSPRSLVGTIEITDGSDTWRYRPKDRIWEQIPSAFPKAAWTSYSRASDNYRVEIVGSEKVAGRDTYVVRAVPKRGGEAYHSIWIDKGCYLTLRTQTQTTGGRLLSMSKFSSIEINPKDISRSAFAVTGQVKSAERPARVDFRIEKPSYLPKGYRLAGLASVTVNSHCCAHLQFSNGANVISLFERRTANASSAPKVPEKLRNIMSWTRDGILFTLIGDISRDELRKIADSTK